MAIFNILYAAHVKFEPEIAWHFFLNCLKKKISAFVLENIQIGSRIKKPPCFGNTIIAKEVLSSSKVKCRQVASDRSSVGAYEHVNSHKKRNEKLFN